MTQYFATFISGAQEIVLRQLKKLPVERLGVTYIDDGLVIFDADFPPARIIDFRFFNNTFLLLKDFGARSDNTLEAMADELFAANFAGKAELDRLATNKSPKVSALHGNQPVPLAKRQALESHLAQRLQSHGGGLAQFQLILRRDGEGLFGLKLSRPLFKRSKRPAGALRPELVHLLCLVANASGKDIVLDPFAGHGTVIGECLQGFQVHQVIAIEKDAGLFDQLKRTYRPSNVRLIHGSATHIPMDDASVTKIITDPPWGMHGDINRQDLLGLYRQSLEEMARVLKPGGILVLLSGNDALHRMAEDLNQLELVKAYNVLVSGKKATILKLRKKM